MNSPAASWNSPASRRTVLATALAAAGAGVLSAAAPALAAAPSAPSGRSGPPAAHRRAGGTPVDNRFWSSAADWRGGTAHGTKVLSGSRSGLAFATPAGTTDYTDPHTGKTSTWEYATWTSPVHRSRVPATEAIASWNADTPAGTWIQTELRGTYSDGGATPWYVMGRWASGDGDIRRTSVDDQTDDRSSVWTDTFAVDDPASGLRLVSYQLRLTLHRKPGTTLTPTVRRVGAMASDIPDRFTVPAAGPRVARELTVPRYSQNTHIGQYPEYDNGGEAWCSPTSSQMIIEYWGRKPTAADLAWVNPDFADPQVCHAARFTFDYQYDGCGNWPFNAAYAAAYEDMNAVVTRLGSLTDVERLIRAGIPVITSQSFLASELTGAGYGTSGHLMTVIGFTAAGDVIANDPASPSNEAVRRIYKRREWENIWLRTKRYNASGTVVSGTGGVCYLYWPVEPTSAQRKALEAVGVR
ncbi:peptidase C39 family protein [Streptomyces sp. NP-1717]|uniref:peptidase C39 family protein n=1 Tax=unclassified Streptomyces TaxID=2593676 RepID=UPI001F5D537C|nr:peptidase C39 family protein [Streptomyces sp. NP-1717]MCI3225686.1 peptidase C39 family protein [Streptomyces sp. NP-1717]WTA72327.1 peptidase C39 family protein [Streptomyces sp. NBC_00838]